MGDGGAGTLLARTRNRWLAGVAAAVALAVAAGLTGVHALGLDDLPDATSVMSSGLPNDTLVYDRTGTVLLAELQQSAQEHSDLRLSAMGRWLPAATVAAEDPGFWSEPSPTITQRLVRLRLPGYGGGDARLQRAVLALRVCLAYPRDRILEAYLNSLPYGSQAIGAEAAAVTYFQEDASQLDLAQAALLAGLPSAPSLLNPLKNLPAARQRQREVLDAMVRSHAVSRRQADDAAAETLLLTGPAGLDVVPGFVHLVTAELTRRLGQAAVARGGLSVLSTLDWGIQQQAQLIMHAALDANRARGATMGALAAIDPRTGRVLALVGNADPTGRAGALDFAGALPVNPGTAMAALSYAAAIASRRYTMVTPVADASLRIVGGSGTYVVRDFAGTYRGTCELSACLAASLNVPAVLVELGVGVPEVVRTARALGAPPESLDAQGALVADAPPEQFGPSLALGGYPETVLGMATAYAALGAAGVAHDPEAILRVTASGGGAVPGAANGAGSRQAIDPGAAFIVSQMLADDAGRAPAFGAGGPLVLPGRHAAAAVGTSESFKDAWTVGYTPSLAAAVWLGNVMGNDRTMSPGSDGMTVAAPAWHRFMQAALDQLQAGDEWYTPPADVVTSTASGRTAWFLAGTSAATPPPALPATVQLG